MNLRFASVATLLLLAGCSGGRPTRYLSLAPVPGPAVTVPRDAPVAVARVQIPAALDRLRLVRGSGVETATVAPHTEWIAPLDGMTQLVLARDLAARIPGTHVLMPGDPVPSGGVRLVRVNVLRFLPVLQGPDAGRVVLEADWAVLGRHGGRSLASGRTRIVVAGGPDGAAQAAAMSATLGRLADRIATGLARA